MTPPYPHLLAPLAIGALRLRNRILFRAHRTNLAGCGGSSAALEAYYAARAAGGCGGIVVGDISFHPGDRPYEKMIEAYTPEGMAGLEQVAGTIRQNGAAAFAQINHRGFQSHGAISRQPTWGPVPTADVVYGEVCHRMGHGEIHEVTDALARGAGALKTAGYDGVVVSIGPNSLLRQFLSPLTNTRDDGYGGDLAGRLRLALEVLTAVRATVGPGYPVAVDLCLDEMFYGALGSDEALAAAGRIEAAGLADLFLTTAGTYYNLHLARASMHHPVGLIADKVAALKASVSRPVAASIRITTPAMAEEMVAGGRTDLIAWQRPLICDPDLPNKLAAGRTDDVVHCLYDNQGCVGRTHRDRTIGCVRNPWVGRECGQHSWDDPKTARRVVVVGAGPAGMEAARVAASRGHAVQLFDGADAPGGQLRLARRQPGREALGALVDDMADRLSHAGVSLHLNRRLTLEDIQSLNPEVVILAQGSRPHPRPVPGTYGPPAVLTLWEALEEIHPVGQRVLVIDEDGHFKAPLTAVMLAERGCTVALMTSDLFAGVDLASQGDLGVLRSQLDSRTIAIHCDQVVTAIEGTTVHTLDKHSGAPKIWDGWDTIITVMRQVPRERLYQDLKTLGRRVLRAGDCVAPRRMDAAIREGRLAGLRV